MRDQLHSAHRYESRMQSMAQRSWRCAIAGVTLAGRLAAMLGTKLRQVVLVVKIVTHDDV
jgi:phosphoribosylcarboxyaminoimidazole (NCAIR) mutase